MTELTFENVNQIQKRKVSISEYYHASVGTNKNSLEVPRECVCIIEGEFEGGVSQIDLERWQNALTQATLANPGSYLAMHGKRRASFWNNDGAMPRIRIVEDCSWDGLSSTGSEFIFAEPLGLRGEPCVELLLAGGEKQYVILRVMHAVMDGVGELHFYNEFFRALRGEELVGTNSLITDLELLEYIPKGKRIKLKGKPPHATGGPRGNEPGDCWQSIRVRGPKPKILQRVILGIAQMAANYSDKPTRIALPIDLRRHFPRLNSTLNYTSMVHLDVIAKDSIENVTEKMKHLMDINADANIPPSADFLKILPFTWMDKLMCRTKQNYTKRRLFETAVVTNIGRHRSKKYSGGGFTAKRIFSVPIPGNTMVSIMNMDNDITINVGTEKVYASEGRLEALVQYIEKALE